jgi:outer membrane protein assembly factor BamB
MKNSFSLTDTKSKGQKLHALTSLLLVLTIALTLVALPLANAHTPAWTIPTYAYVACSPNTVGVGQYTLIVMWLDKYPATAGGLGGDRWRGFKLDITKPDGSKETIPYTGETSQVGSAWVLYTPDQVGDYTIVFSWPGQTLTNGTGSPRYSEYEGDYFMGATSAPCILHVQKEPISGWQEPPVPTDYWTRPIPTANREWAQLTSNWLGGSWLRYTNFQEEGRAPNTPHIVWTRPVISGGISSARYGAVKYQATDYDSLLTGPIIMNGKVYYTAKTSTYGRYGYYCLDLRTGEQLWYKNGTDNGITPTVSVRYSGLHGAGVYSGQQFPVLAFGQLYHYYSVNGEGIWSYLWLTQSGTPQTTTSGGTMWHMMDPDTGNWIMSLKNVPTGTSITDQDGSLLLYTYSSTTGRFLCWNSSQAIPPASPTGTGQQQWHPPVGAVIDAVNDTTWQQWGIPSGSGFDQIDISPRSGYTMNVTGPVGLPSLSSVLSDNKNVPRIMFFSDMRNSPSFGSSDMYFRAAAVRIEYHVAPYSPYPNKTNTQNYDLGYGVTLLWNKTITKPLGGNLTFSIGPISYEDRVFTVWCKEKMQWWGYSLDDGSLLWGPTDPQGAWDMYGSGGFYAYGKLFSGYLGGIVYCYDIKTGKLLWNYTAAGIGYESPYGNYDVGFGGKRAADGKLFVSSSEHSPTQPLWRGSYLRAIDVNTGKEVWKLLDWVSGFAMADGYIVTGNYYDNQMYCIGKGPSVTTVDAPMTGVPAGSTIIIRGTVTDQSPGAKALAEKMGYSNGIPAVADADMQAWMEYLYMQQARPTNAKGVEVTLDAIGPDGKLISIGKATTDLSGLYSCTFTPSTPGVYTIIATFQGSESYFSSFAETAIVVTQAPSPSIPATPPPTSASPSASASPTTAPPPGGAPGIDIFMVAAAVAVIAVIIAAALALKRRTK